MSAQVAVDSRDCTEGMCRRDDMYVYLADRVGTRPYRSVCEDAQDLQVLEDRR